MKYFNNKYRKREKLVDQYQRLTKGPFHTKQRVDRNAGLVLQEINRQLYLLFPVMMHHYVWWGTKVIPIVPGRYTARVSKHPILTAGSSRG